MKIISIRVRRHFPLGVPHRNVRSPPLLIAPCRSLIQNSVHLIFLSNTEIHFHTQISKWRKKMIICEWEEGPNKQKCRIIISHRAAHLYISVVM